MGNSLGSWWSKLAGKKSSDLSNLSTGQMGVIRDVWPVSRLHVFDKHLVGASDSEEKKMRCSWGMSVLENVTVVNK